MVLGLLFSGLMSLKTIVKFMTSTIAKQAFAGIVLLSSSFAFGVAPQAKAEPSESRASMRLTHLLFAAVLDRYAEDGLEKYRPDFLLHERYLRTFIHEWGLLLDTQSANSTLDAWTQISQRPSYLGANFEIWKRTLPGYFDVRNTNQRINIGNYRETFLAVVLRSELNSDGSFADFNRRSKTILEATATFLLMQNADNDLGLKIADAFLSSPQAELRTHAASILENIESSVMMVETFGLVRNLALGFATGGPGTAGIAGAAAISAFRGMAGAARLKFINAIRIPEIAKQWVKVPALWRKNPAIAKAGATSLAVHGAVLLKPQFETSSNGSGSSGRAGGSSPTTRRYTPEASSTLVKFLIAMSTNTASERSTRVLEQRDFALPRPTQQMLSKMEWIDVARQRLAGWNATGRVSNLAELFLEGERLSGYWPDDTALARMTLESKLLRLKRRISESRITTIEELRENIFENELEDYRGKRRTLTGVLLDWGGNCVAQTMTLISLLTEFPQLVPAGAQLGVYISSTHMEAVLLTQDKIQFLVSGKMLDRVPTVTVLKPATLLLQALHSMGDTNLPITGDEYLNGKPPRSALKIPPFKFLTALSNLFSESGLLDNGLFSPVEGAKSDAPNAPSHARVTYQQLSNEVTTGEDGSSAESGFDSVLEGIWPSSFGAGFRQVKTEFISGEDRRIEICMTKRIPKQLDFCKFKRKPLRESKTISSMWENYEILDNSSHSSVVKFYHHWRGPKNPTFLGISGLTLDLSPKTDSILRSLQPDFRLLKLNQIDFETNTKSWDALSPEAISRLKNLQLKPEDFAVLRAMRLFNYRVIERSTKNTHDQMQLGEHAWAFIFSSLVPSIQVQHPYPAESSKSVLIERLTFVRTAMARIAAYRQWLIRHFGQNLELEALLKNDRAFQETQMMISFEEALIEIVSKRPDDFIRMFHKLDQKSKLEFIKWARALGENEPVLLPLRNFLDQLKPEQIGLVEPVVPKYSHCVPFAKDFKPATCLSAEGCKAFRVISPPPKCPPSPSTAAVDLTLKKPEVKNFPDVSSTDEKLLLLTARDVAELSILSSGGFQLWDERVFAAAHLAAVDWFTADVHPGIELVKSFNLSKVSKLHESNYSKARDLMIKRYFEWKYSK